MRAETPKTERFEAPFRREGESLYKLNRVSFPGKSRGLAPSEARSETAKSLPACKYSALSSVALAKEDDSKSSYARGRQQ